MIYNNIKHKFIIHYNITYTESKGHIPVIYVQIKNKFNVLRA